jgi:DNA polymerase-3 subunit chi
VQRASPVALGPDPHAWDMDEVLLNLGDEVPEGFERFDRLIEIVSSDDHGRAQARVRWKHYKSLGYELQQHDLSKAAET